MFVRVTCVHYFKKHTFFLLTFSSEVLKKSEKVHVDGQVRIL